MKQQNELHIIEKKYVLNDIKFDDVFAWPLLRQRVYFEIIKDKFNFNSKLRTRNKLQLIKNVFYGWTNLLRLKKFDFIFFNNTDKRKLEVNNKKIDVFFDAWADKLGQDRSLFIEWAIDKHFSKKETHSKHVISDLIFKYCCYILAFFCKIKLNNVNVLEDLKKDYKINFNEIKELKQKKGELLFYQFLFKIIKPKAIFLISSFTKVPIILAAHLENIIVYEAQHGYIGENHQFYNSYYNFNSFYYPDYLLSFGDYEKQNIPEGFIFKSPQILPIGSSHLEETKINFKSNKLKTLKSKYKHIFCVALQTVKEEKLLTWVTKQAKRYPDWLFIIKPKNESLNYSYYTKLSNCLVLPEYNIYQILKYSDYNITIYSTVAIEAPFYGVKTLFYNIQGLSIKYFNPDKMFASLLEEEEQLCEHILNKNNNKFFSYFIENYYNNVSLIKFEI